jgi:MFS family permease
MLPAFSEGFYPVGWQTGKLKPPNPGMAGLQCGSGANSFLRNRINKLILVSVTCLLSGVTLASWLATHTNGGIIGFAATYGFISGGLVSLPPPTVATLSKTQDEYSTRMGMAFTICSFGALIGNPIAGALITGRSNPDHESFVGPWLFSGGTMFAAAALAIAAYQLHRKTTGGSGRSSRGGSLERRSSSKLFQSLASEALTMQGAAFAL